MIGGVGLTPGCLGGRVAKCSFMVGKMNEETASGGTAHENHGRRPSQHEDYMKRHIKYMKKNNSGKNTRRASQINKGVGSVDRDSRLLIIVTNSVSNSGSDEKFSK